MSISALATYTQLSPNCNKPRKNPISRITPHHMAGSLSLPQFGALVAKPSRQMSANYAIAKDGSIGAFCDEDNRSWCSSSPYNDHRAVTIEVANDGGASTNWHVSDAALESLVKLCVDICQRNPGLKNGLNYTGDARGNLTKHSYFTATACPGNYLGGKFAWLAGEVNKRLLGTGQEDVELRAGTALHLERANLYVASTSLTIAGVRTGTFYLWGKEGVIVVLLGLLGTVTAPMIKLNTTLTKLNDKFETLDSKLTDVTESNHDSHKRLWEHEEAQDNTLHNHETRIQILEGHAPRPVHYPEKGEIDHEH